MACNFCLFLLLKDGVICEGTPLLLKGASIIWHTRAAGSQLDMNEAKFQCFKASRKVASILNSKGNIY